MQTLLRLLSLDGKHPLGPLPNQESSRHDLFKTGETFWDLAVLLVYKSFSGFPELLHRAENINQEQESSYSYLFHVDLLGQGLVKLHGVEKLLLLV